MIGRGYIGDTSKYIYSFINNYYEDNAQLEITRFVVVNIT
jgi:hypothetical protein